VVKTYISFEKRYAGSEFLNISFVANNSCQYLSSPYEWRGKLFFKSINKNNKHLAKIYGYEDFLKDEKVICDILDSSQLFVLEASLRPDFINIINFLKSKNKKVVVDIPLGTDILDPASIQSDEQKSRSSRLFSIQQVFNTHNIDDLTSFRWGLNLADHILVTSEFQYEKWQCCTPMILVPEFFDCSELEMISIPEAENTIVGVFLTGTEKDQYLLEVLDFVHNKFNNIKFNFFHFPHLLKMSNNFHNTSKFQLNTNDYRRLLASDVGIFWDTLSVRGIFIRNILEYLFKKKPIIINNAKGYHDLAKYGLIVEENHSWKSDLVNLIHNNKEHLPTSENGYLYSIGRSVDDNIDHVIRQFSEIMKVS